MSGFCWHIDGATCDNCDPRKGVYTKPPTSYPWPAPTQSADTLALARIEKLLESILTVLKERTTGGKDNNG